MMFQICGYVGNSAKPGNQKRLPTSTERLPTSEGNDNTKIPRTGKYSSQRLLPDDYKKNPSNRQ